MELYSVYKKTTIAFVLTAFLATAGTIAHIEVVEAKTPESVQELDQGAIESVTEVEELINEGSTIFFSTASSDSEYIWVPMADDVSASDVVIENHYMDKQLWIAVNNSNSTFYRNSYISGNLENIVNGELTVSDEQVIIKLTLDHIFEYNTIFEDGVLYIEKVSPSSIYEKIVVIDPAGELSDGYSMENSLSSERICLDIAAKLKSGLETQSIKVYITGLDEKEVTDEERLFLLKEVKPDMYVRIETGVSDNSKEYGTETIYNGTYFIPKFGSVELADLLEKNVTTSIGGKVGGLALAGENDYVIMNATVPAATIKVGYFTNMQENILLNRDDYRSKIANGIIAAIMEAYE